MEIELTRTPAINSYLEAFGKLKDRLPNDTFAQTREIALALLTEKGLPTTRHEDWKYTNLLPLEKEAFTPLLPNELAAETDVRPFDFGNEPVNLVVLVNGAYSPTLSHIAETDKLYSNSINSAKEDAKYQDLISEYFKGRNNSQDAVLALNTAFTTDGAFIHIAKGAVLEHPIVLQSIVTNQTAGHSIHPTNIVLADANSQATIIHLYNDQTQQHWFNNPATHFQLNANAGVAYHQTHVSTLHGYHVGYLSATLQQDARFSAHTLNFGGQLVRNNVSVHLNGTGADADLKGVYVLDGKEHVDNHIVINHNAPNCTSNQLYKGLMDGHSTGVFNGRIYVKKDAQKTNAFQSNKNVLLSADANVYSKPQLEIFADDVKCSHGSTTGQIDHKALFYLQARGIEKSTALAMLNEAFANEVLRDIAYEPLKAWATAELAKKLHSENYIY